jgi:hypothetical protein
VAPGARSLRTGPPKSSTPVRALEGPAEMQLGAEIATGFLGANARRVFRL